jgi:hypothetical protein
MEEERLVFDDADDNVTYAPEIQSVEIPPDQLSQSSLNLVENFSEHQELHQHIQQVPEVEDGEEAARRRVPSGEKEEQAVPEQHAYPSPRDEIWRAPSPRRSTIEVQQAPQAPQFIRNNFDEPSVSSLSSVQYKIFLIMKII